jgi:ATP-binding cassette, subfamily B (MDR/TAP), member 1
MTLHFVVDIVLSAKKCMICFALPYNNILVLVRMPTKNSRERKSLQIEDASMSQNFRESSSPKMAKSPSLQRTHGMLQFWRPDTNRNSHESPKDRSPPSEQTTDNGIPMVAIETERNPSIKRQDSFEMKLPDLPKVDVHPIQRQSSKNSEPDSPISPLLTSDPMNERSHSQTFSRPQSERDDSSSEQSELDEVQEHKPPSFWQLAGLSIAEWPYALLGTIGAAIFGSFNPLLAYTIALIVSAYYRIEVGDMHHEVNKWCLFIVGMGVITVLANWLQHFYFGIMGEKMTERIRRMMFSGNFYLHVPILVLCKVVFLFACFVLFSLFVF